MSDRHTDENRLDGLTGQTVELLQVMIRNRCVNNGTAESGYESRNADTLMAFLDGSGADIQQFESRPGRASLVARMSGIDASAPALCLMGHTDVVPVDEEGWSRDPFGGELVDGEVWGRGAVDMLNMTASMAVAFRYLACHGFRPRGDLVYFAVADEESGGKYGAGWMADHEPQAIRADYVLTEGGGLHGGRRDTPYVGITVAEKGVAWRRLHIRGTPGHGSQPWRSDNALVRAAQVIERLAAYNPPVMFGDLWRLRVDALDVSEDIRQALLDPKRIDSVLRDLPNTALASDLHACTHTTFSPNVISGDMKINVIPGAVDLYVDIRTLPGQDAVDVDGHLTSALGDLASHIQVETVLTDLATTSPIASPLWDSLGRAVARQFPKARLLPQIVVGATDARFYRRLGSTAYGAGLFSPNLDPDDYAQRFHGNDERIDVESLHLTTSLWLDVIEDLLST
jgi:acetylornithine deacetylase/succinyl-diaminopimelate desuccinylase-like protein